MKFRSMRWISRKEDEKEFSVIQMSKMTFLSFPKRATITLLIKIIPTGNYNKCQYTTLIHKPFNSLELVRSFSVVVVVESQNGRRRLSGSSRITFNRRLRSSVRTSGLGRFQVSRKGRWGSFERRVQNISASSWGSRVGGREINVVQPVGEACWDATDCEDYLENIKWLKHAV